MSVNYSPGPASLTLMMAVRIISQSIVMSHNEHESGVNKKKLLAIDASNCFSPILFYSNGLIIEEKLIH